MPHHDQIKIEGKVLDVFAHRFVVETSNGKILADLGKHNSERVNVVAGDEVVLWGEQKPSELKINRITLNGRTEPLEQKDKHDLKAQELLPVNPEIAISAAQKECLTVIGRPHRKPNHFEVLGKNSHNELVELHIEFDGKVRESKSVKRDDVKWAEELAAA